LVDSLVGVVILSLETSNVVNVLEGVGWESTTAAMIVIVVSAVNKLLLTQVSELAELDQIVSFKGAYSGESPAAATLGLILDGGDTTDIPPVPVGGDILELVTLFGLIAG